MPRVVHAPAGAADVVSTPPQQRETGARRQKHLNGKGNSDHANEAQTGMQHVDFPCNGHFADSVMGG